MPDEFGICYGLVFPLYTNNLLNYIETNRELTYCAHYCKFQHYKTSRFLFAEALPIWCPGTNNAILRLARALAATGKGEKNILLRDLKPSNILVSWYGWTKWEQPDDPKFLRKNLELTLIDFGISKEILDQKMSAETNTADRGTPAYIAPEVRASIVKQTRYNMIET